MRFWNYKGLYDVIIREYENKIIDDIILPTGFKLKPSQQ